MAGLPEAFKNEMQVLLGENFASFVRALEEPPPVSVRYNPLKLSPAAGTPVPWCTQARYLDERPSFTLDPLFHAGGYYVQEASSMLLEQAVSQLIGHRPIIAVDLCAAPGGKSTHLLSLLSRYSLLIANEAIRGRVGMLSENMEKWGYENVIVTHNDPGDFARVPEFADLVLVDAPCSGEGLFRKDPDAMREWSPHHVELCSLRQRRIVSDAWALLKPGGTLIYSTCTYNHQENLGNLNWLAGNYELEFESLLMNPNWGVQEMREGNCMGYQCFPHRVRGEGYFLSVIRKRGTSKARGNRPRHKLRHPSEKELGAAREWITHPENMLFFLHGQQVRFLPAQHENDLLNILDNLHVIQAGSALGEIMKNKIVPDHGLALSVSRNKNALPVLNLDRAQALAYLRKESTLPAAENTGFHVVEFEGLGLGWMNVLPNRMNNLYPAARRIRMTE